MNAKRSEKNTKVDHPYFSNSSEPLLHAGGRPPLRTSARLDWRQALGVLLIGGGLVSLIAGYVGISGTKETYDQLTYFLGNGLGGAALIIVGSTVLVIREHAADREAMARLDDRLSSIDRRLPAEARSNDGRTDGGAYTKSSNQNGAVSGAPSVQPA